MSGAAKRPASTTAIVVPAASRSRDPATAADLRHEIDRWRQEGVRVERLDGVAGLARVEPALAPHGTLGTCCYLARNANCAIRVTCGLLAAWASAASRLPPACQPKISSSPAAASPRSAPRPVRSPPIDLHRRRGLEPCADGRIARPPAIVPVRGQIVLLAEQNPGARRVVNEGQRYLVPRGDGRVLVGSTEEDVGFDRSTTAGAIEGLLEFASRSSPRWPRRGSNALGPACDPVSADRRPYLGRIPGYDNAFLAAGHGRAGLAAFDRHRRVMSRLISGQVGADRPGAVSRRPRRPA